CGIDAGYNIVQHNLSIACAMGWESNNQTEANNSIGNLIDSNEIEKGSGNAKNCATCSGGVFLTGGKNGGLMYGNTVSKNVTHSAVTLYQGQGNTNVNNSGFTLR